MKKLCLALAVVMLLAAVSGGASAQSSQETPTFDNVVIKAYGLTTGYADLVDQFVPDFNSLNLGITLEWEIPGDEPYTVLKTRFASDEGPDIFDLGPGDFAVWGERCADLSNEPFLATLQPASREAVTVDGQVLGFPYAVEGNGILYNKDLFELAGIAEVPKTIDELEQACIQLQAAGIQPFGEAWKDWGFLAHIFGTPFAYEENEQEICEKLNSGEMKMADMTYMDNFFRLFDMTVDYGKGVESIGYGVVDQMTDFMMGKIAMVKQGTWMTDIIYATNPAMNIGLFAVPLTNDPAQSKMMVTTARYFVLNKDSENLEAAKVFLNWYYEHLQEYIIGFHVSAPFDNMDFSNLGALYEDVFKYTDSDMVYSTFGSTYWPTGFQVDLASPLQAYIAGVIDQDEALAQLQELYDNRVKAIAN